jgi:hypothetical protein
MFAIGVAYAAVVMLGDDRCLQAIWNQRHRGHLHLPILMLLPAVQMAVVLLAAVKIWQ